MTREAQDPKPNETNEFENSLIMESFKEARAEINLRIQNHTSLVTLKIATTGALLAFLLTKNVSVIPEMTTLGVVLVPLIAFLFDVTIAKNIRNIHMLASFIRYHIEPKLQRGTMWEKYGGQSDERYERCYDRADVNTLALFTLGTVVIAIYVLLKSYMGLFMDVSTGIGIKLLTALPIVIIVSILVVGFYHVWVIMYRWIHLFRGDPEEQFGRKAASRELRKDLWSRQEGRDDAKGNSPRTS